MPRLFTSVGWRAGQRVRTGDRTVPLLNGKVVDVTGPRLTDRWGITCTDLGASVIAPNGKLVSVFGDTFSGCKVGQGDWRSPVVLIGTGDANHEIVYERAGGDDPDYARQLWHYVHDDEGTGWTRGGVGLLVSQWNTAVGWPYRAMQFKAALRDTTKTVHPPDPINL